MEQPKPKLAHPLNPKCLSFTVECARQLEYPLVAISNIQTESEFTRTLNVTSLTLRCDGPPLRLGTCSVFLIQDLLQRTRLPLQNFVVDLDIFRWMGNVIVGEILETFSNTLRTLWVENLRNSNEFLTVPMTALENLKFSVSHLISPLSTDPARYSTAVKFFHFLPKLCLLDVKDFDLENLGPTILMSTSEHSEMALSFANESVTKLVYNVEKKYETEKNQYTKCAEFILEGIQNFTNLMPNITVLEFPLDNESFRLVCRGWPALKELTILKHWSANWSVDDAGITGFTGTGRDFLMGERLPNITNLKELRTFRMNFCNLLSQDSIQFGFAQLPNLNCLEMQLIPGQFGDGLQHLLDRVPNIIFRYVE